MDRAQRARSQRLHGGNASGEVLRVGGTVRKPWTPAAPAVHGLLAHLRAHGVDVPEVHGRDDVGRQVLEFIPGETVEGRRLGLADLREIGALVRRIHDASAFHTAAPEARWEPVIPAPSHELICHHDLAPWNLVLGERMVFIDWDGAGPSSRLWDLAYAAQSFTLNDPDEDPTTAVARLQAFIAGYEAGCEAGYEAGPGDADGADTEGREGAELRRALPQAMAARTAAMHRLLRESHEQGREPWGSMYSAGHGAHWAAVTENLRRHERIWREALLPHG